MKQLLLLATGLLGLCTLGLTSAQAGQDDYYQRRDNGDYGYRRPVYHERYHDDCEYRPRRRVVVIREYDRPCYRENYYRPYPHRRHHVNFFLPLPPPPF